jgi:aryl-alcohol dehydrogenase-like predicted oxidoreductase
LIRRDVEAEILPFAAREQIGVIAYSPMGSGLLTGAMTRERIAALPADDWRRDNPDFQEPRLSRNLELVRLLRRIGVMHGRTPAQVAVAWVLHNPAVTGAILGARRPGQLVELIPATEFQLEPGEVTQIESFAASSGQSQSLAAVR